MTYICTIGMCPERIEAPTPAQAAQEYASRMANRHSNHILTSDDGTLTVYESVEVDGHGHWIVRTYLRPLRRKGGVRGPEKPRRILADIEKAMGLAPGFLSGDWEYEEEDWR